MQQEFESFLAAWQKVMNAKGGISLPARKDITVKEFAPWLPHMMIARWDFDGPSSDVLYAGSQIDDLFAVDIASQDINSFFKDSESLKWHIETARHVVTELVAGYAKGHIMLPTWDSLEIDQLRLPLAPEDGLPVVVSLFRSFDPKFAEKRAKLPECPAQSDSAKSPFYKGPATVITSVDYLPLFDDE